MKTIEIVFGILFLLGAARAGVAFVRGWLDPPLERPVLDLHVEVAAAGGPRADARDDQRPVVGKDPQALGIDSRQLDDDPELGRFLGADDVDLRPKAAPQTREARHLPELVDELLDLALQLVELVSLPSHDR